MHLNEVALICQASQWKDPVYSQKYQGEHTLHHGEAASLAYEQIYIFM